MDEVEQLGLVQVGHGPQVQAKQGGDTWEAASLIAAYHQLRRLSTEAEPRLTGDELRMNYQVPTMEGQDMMMGTAMVGILAAVAVPAYIKYAAKAKAAEIPPCSPAAGRAQ